MKIKMSDVFELPLKGPYLGMDRKYIKDSNGFNVASGNDEIKAMAIAESINAYDDNQGRIAELEKFILNQAKNCLDEINRNGEIIRPKVDAHNTVYGASK